MTRTITPTRVRLALLMVARLAFGGLLLWASFGKISNPEHFAPEVEKYQLLNASDSGALAVVLPWAEFLTGFSLIVGFWPTATWLAAISLFGLFTFVRASALHRGLDIACGCGIGEAEITPRSLVYSTTLLVAAIGAYVATMWAPRAPATARLTPVTHSDESMGMGSTQVGVS
jgi:uncharacterized membrane protein YphA (DoxX/SURF4 family)